MPDLNRPTQPSKVLIVDDEDLARLLLKHIIERMNIPELQILVAADGVEAIEIIEAERPELILLDVLLPKMDGYDVCRRVRQIAGYDPYVIILTARGVRTDREHAQEMGANDFMTKPFNPSRLISRVAELWSL